MRALLALAAMALLAGCSGSDDSGPSGSDTSTSDSTTGSGTTSSGTSTTGPTVPANATVMDCVVNVGGAGNGYAVVAGQNVGGCSFEGDNPVTADGTVTAVSFATGCVGWSDSTPGDGMSDGDVAVGEQYDEDTEFGVYCDATMTANSANSLTFLPQA